MQSSAKKYVRTPTLGVGTPLRKAIDPALTIDVETRAIEKKISQSKSQRIYTTRSTKYNLIFQWWLKILQKKNTDKQSYWAFKASYLSVVFILSDIVTKVSQFNVLLTGLPRETPVADLGHPNSFNFNAVFGKIWQNRMLAPPPPLPGSWRPCPWGNPESAAEPSYI